MNSMRGSLYSDQIREEVDRLRSEGKSYAEIRMIHDIPKSTLSNWLGEKHVGIFNKEAQLEHLKKIRELSALKLRKAKIVRDEIHAARGRKFARSLPSHNLTLQKALLAMLYWAEGKKGGGALVFANTDPRLVLLFITMLRNCFSIDEHKLRARVHLHYYHNKKESLRYWSRLLKIPPDQFGKLYIKKRSKSRKFRQNFKGICFVIYSNTGLLKEILALGEAIGDQVTLNSAPGRNRTYITNSASLRPIH